VKFQKMVRAGIMVCLGLREPRQRERRCASLDAELYLDLCG